MNIALGLAISLRTIAGAGLLCWAWQANAAPACDTAGLVLPSGFCATVFSQSDHRPRHIAVGADGTVYANLSRPDDGHGLAALRDTDGDGRADTRQTFGRGGATGLTIHDQWLYAASPTAIRRYAIRAGQSVPADEGESVVSGLPSQQAHGARGLAVDANDHLYVAIGAPSNACQTHDRVPGSPGQMPCPLLKQHGGVWRFSASQTGQHFSPKARYATGVRNLFALSWDSATEQLYGVQMGRDQLDSLWPDRYTSEDNEHLPAEVLLVVKQGQDYGWPYCYYDDQKQANVLNPEYASAGQTTGRCQHVAKPAAAYPAHWAPMAIAFYHANAFPAAYRDGAFIAFHGSWNRAPAPQGGFQVIYQPFEDGQPTPDWQPFAGPRGFTGQASIRSPRMADHRPAGVAVGPDGALYVSDDQGGTIYRITYQGTPQSGHH